MADEADRGNDTAELFLGVALKNVAPPGIPAGIGMCLNCGDEAPGDARWCDPACRDDWQAAEAARKMRRANAA